VAELDIVVNVETGSIDPEPLRRAVAHTAAFEGGPSGEISVTLLDDEGIRDINRRYLDRDRPTDVIAFSLGEAPTVLGDVYIGFDQACRQAAEAGVSLEEELVRLAVHGTLHVLGHDHPEGDDRVTSPMFVLQERLVSELLGD
jgi:probable rRNA maturation factor